MTPENLQALKFVLDAKKAPTKTQFLAHFGQDAETLLSAISAHVDEVKGKLVVNTAGLWVLENTKQE